MIQDNVANGNTNTAYWAEHASFIIDAYDLKKTSANEYHGACPSCGGKDRFWISNYQGEIKVNCRQCNDFKGIINLMRKDGLYPEFKKSDTQAKVTKISEAMLPQPEELHPYLTRKRIKLHNAEIDGPDLRIPIINNKGKVVGTQFIDEDGKKKFSFQMPVIGNFTVINGPITDFAYICEGFATAAAVAEATGKPAVHALNAGNIAAVCKSIQEVKPQARLIVAGDNDDAGIKACEKAFIECGVEHVLPPNEGQDWNDIWCAKGADATRKLLVPRNILDEVVFPEDAVAQLARTYIVKGWITENTISAVYGASNVGKSFFCLDLSWHIAAKQNWNGFRVSGGSVLYLATEGGNAFQNRLIALRNKYPEHKDVKLAVRPSPINLYNAEEDIAKVEALISQISKKHGQVQMLVIDTLSRATQGQMDENSNSEAARFINQLDAIRDRTGVHIMIVAHSGKDTSKGLRGASSIRAAVDTEIELSYDIDTHIRTAKATKQRDMETGAEFSFILEQMILGKDEDGDEVSTCTIRLASAEELEDSAKPQIKGKNQKLFKQVFYQLRGEGIGWPNPSGAGWPESGMYWCIDEGVLQDHFVGKLVGVSRPLQTYKQTVTSLVALGHVSANSGAIWFCDKNGKVGKRGTDAPF